MSNVFRYDRLRDSKAAFKKFEHDNGKVGSVAMAAFILEAARITGRSAKSIERIAMAQPRGHALRAGQKKTLRDGRFEIGARRGRRPAQLGTVRLQNRGRKPVIVIQESIDEHGRPQGVQFIVLHPGDVFESRHNAVPVIVVVIVIGIIVIVLIIIGEAIVGVIWGAGRCTLVPQLLSKNYCSGTCAASPTTGFPMSCTVTATDSYYYFGREAAACACV